MNIIKRYWAVILSVIFVVLAIISVALHRQSFNVLFAIHQDNFDGKGFIYWPILGACDECLIIPVGGLIIFLLTIVSGKGSRPTAYSLLIMITLSVVAFLFMVLSAMGDPAIVPVQIASNQLRGTNYYLINVHSVMSLNGNQYVLLKCRVMNLGCEVAYKHPALDEQSDDIKLQMSSNGENVVLILGNQTVYTSE